MIGAGQTLDGTYQLGQPIGEGGMGVVYEATHARLAGRYAIKVLLRSLVDSPAAQARFDREAQVTSLLQHPNVVQVIDHNTAADGTPYLVMEYLSGESLAERLARTGPLPVAQVAEIVDQIAAGLTAAHAYGIVHRDLKPDNIFLVPVEGHDNELVKILDFGISKVSWGTQRMDRELCGTPQYMAPEQVEGRTAEVGAAADQFALAVIAYELLTAHNPFIADTVTDVFTRILRDAVVPTGIHWQLDAVLARGLSKSTAVRFPTVADFAAAFRAAAVVATGASTATTTAETLSAAEATSSAAFEGPRRPGWRRAQRPRWALAVGALVSATVVSATVGAALLLGGGPSPRVTRARSAPTLAPTAPALAAAPERARPVPVAAPDPVPAAAPSSRIRSRSASGRGLGSRSARASWKAAAPRRAPAAGPGRRRRSRRDDGAVALVRLTAIRRRRRRRPGEAPDTRAPRSRSRSRT